jgi:hypothetical protein
MLEINNIVLEIPNIMLELVNKIMNYEKNNVYSRTVSSRAYYHDMVADPI